MEIDEAINYIQLQKNFWSVIGEDEELSVVKSLEMAISALRTQQEAGKECKYCCDGDAIALDSCSAIRIERDGQNYVMGGSDWESEINYCPMCGRQLRRPPKEAHNV